MRGPNRLSFFNVAACSRARTAARAGARSALAWADPYVVSALAIDPATPTTLYAGTSGGVYKSTDGGGNWSAVNTGLGSAAVSALAVDPVTPTTLYAGTAGGVFKSTDGGGELERGQHWPDAIPLFLPWRSIRRRRPPSTPGHLAACSRARTAARNWSAVNTGLGSAAVSALAIDPVTPTTLYAGTDGGGVFKSTNGGANWSTVNAGLITTDRFCPGDRSGDTDHPLCRDIWRRVQEHGRRRELESWSTRD